MKRTILLVLCMMAVMAMNAGDVTPNEALQKATQFVNNRIAHGHGPRLAPGAQPRLTLASRVSGLYVYNVQNKGGFVIVSPDDETETILGYSDSGEFDESHMPDNMRYWLQGYAEEIAYLRGARYEVRGTEDVRGTRYEVRGTEDVRGTRYEVRGTANAPAAASTIKTSIAPLIQTMWDQNEPYNNFTPLTGGQHSATGCAATAMAQVMYFTEMRVGSANTYTTAEIPGYTSKRLNEYISPIPKGTAINWSNMQLTYPSTGTDAEKEAANDAVAHLMFYCGASLTMDYGSTSSANTIDAAQALCNYFGYNSETVQVAVRSCYTYAEWIDLMYFELSHNRPVLYSGQSSGGGHAFICDGYEAEDYFHINWGWSGTSNGNFKLSVLNPKEQGTGGSTSTDGYHNSQKAIIGIQKAEENGEMSGIQPGGYKLNCTSLTFNDTPKANEEITATMTIENTGISDFDGDIYIGFNNNGYTILGVKDFYIPDGETKECIIKFTTRYYGTINVIPFIYQTDGSHITFLMNNSTPLIISSGSGGSR